MKDVTRNQFEGYLRSNRFNLNAQLNFTPVEQQSLYSKMGENADFLKRINHAYVDAQLGEKLGLDVSRPIASRTNVSIQERSTRDLSSLDSDKYYAAKTDFDTHIPYAKLDAWAHLANFADMYKGQVIKQIARDVLMIAWNGETAAEQTDINQYPLLQDVNIGWIAGVKKKQPTRFMGYDATGQLTDDQWKVGKDGEYQTLDALVFDIINSLLDEWHKEAEDLVVLVGRSVWVAHGLSILNNANLPSERSFLETWFASKTVAGLPCLMPPYMPKKAVIVTSLNNLSIYHQLGSLRRTIIDNPKRDRIEEYVSENQAYVVEDFGKFGGILGGSLLLPNGKGGWE